MENYLSGRDYVAKQRRYAEEQYARAVESLRGETAIGEALPDGVLVRQIHASELYGTAGSVHIGGGYGHDAKRYSWGELCDVIRKMPPVPAIIHRGGGTALAPATYTDPRRPDAEIEPIHGLWFEAESPDYAAPSCEAGWYTVLPGGILVRVHVTLSHDASPVHNVIQYRTDKRTGKRIEIMSRGVRFADWWSSKHFRYAGGGLTDGGRVIAYNPREWQAEDLTGDELADILESLRN